MLRPDSAFWARGPHSGYEAIAVPINTPATSALPHFGLRTDARSLGESRDNWVSSVLLNRASASLSVSRLRLRKNATNTALG